MSYFADLTNDPERRPLMFGAELVTTRGTATQRDAQKILGIGKELSGSGIVDWVSITDNAGGHPTLSAQYLAQQVWSTHCDVVVHLTCKDRNRNALESAAWHLASEGLTNILCLTGDYPSDGYAGMAAPVFDIDSTILIRMLKDMNEGLEIPGRKPGTSKQLEGTNFFLGCAVSPFKSNEAEVLCQYLKLGLKRANGADFLIPQLGYDMRKSHELLVYMGAHDLTMPVFGNVYLLNKTVARLFNQQKIPGCVVSDELLAEVEKQAASPDKGRAFFLEFAAKQVACFRGLGCRGVYLAGFRDAADLQQIRDLANSFVEDDWQLFAYELVYPSSPDFYLYAEDQATGLADPTQHSHELRAAEAALDEGELSLPYRFSQVVHNAVFDPRAPLFKPVKRIYQAVDGKNSKLEKALTWQEKVLKKAMFDCGDCGDCALADMYYLCPSSKCRKNQRNGPCGGSRGPLCESRDVKCIWYRAYQRAKDKGELASFLRRHLSVRDSSLQGTSSWANYFLGRDHAKLAANGESEAGQSGAETAEAADESSSETPPSSSTKSASQTP